MRYGLRELAAASLAVAAVCCPAFVGTSAAEPSALRVAQGGPGVGVTPLPETPGRPVVLPDQSRVPAPEASMQGLVPNSSGRPGAVPTPAQSSTQAPKAQPIAGSGAPAGGR